MRVIFQLLWTKTEGLPIRDILDTIPTRIQLSEEETSTASSTGMPLYEKMARTATSPLVEVGWFVKDHERWYLTDDGLQVCRSFRNVEDIYNSAVLLCEEKRQLKADIIATVESAEEQAWQQIWGYLHELNGTDFRVLVADLLQALNYEIDWVAPPRKKHGHIDLVAYPAALSGNGPRIKVHIRHHGQAATVEGLRGFMGELNQHDLGIFVSSGGFTEQVLGIARSQEMRRVRLVSMENFYQFWLQNYNKLSAEAQQRFPLKAIYFLSPQK